ncbi:hypothetical protein [Paludisphaera mucosa]|uniref:Uncharacterized protein n=1 Tax=Paludisphaera mucosa TaxID=3030827 RepID=A0ABT6FAE0_9BACT|nr:hypothetical protein [Paludisphaera mucosa]MDG3004529.1 hypothetical protein [Paludisphaera mucosa]
MRPAHPVTRYPALLLATLAVGAFQPARAQNDPGLSSGSGVGTGTGRSSAVENAPLPGQDPAGRGLEGRPPGGPPPDFTGTTAPLGPGVNTHFPNDPSIAPYLMMDAGGPGGPAGSLRITPEMIDRAKAISEPGERGRILLQIARGSILSNQLTVAHRAIEEAATAATEEPNQLIHDQLIISIVTTAGLLSDALLREGKPQVRLFPDEAEDEKLQPRMAADVAIRLARLEWRRSAFMAQQTRNPTYRSEYLDRAVENMAVGSAIIALEYASSTARDEKVSDEQRAAYSGQADDILEEGADTAQRIERPIWRNRAMERLATAAGESGQYERATDLANRIKNAEARARALVLVAEFQARKSRDDDATRSYNLAAEAVASVQQRGLRGVLAGILIDSLISTGRFDDARASLVLYPSDAERFVAMGAIAESFGLRRMPDEARSWIDRDVPTEYRSTLLRRLNNGLLRGISEARSREFQGGRDAAPSRME